MFVISPKLAKFEKKFAEKMRAYIRRLPDLFRLDHRWFSPFFKQQATQTAKIIQRAAAALQVLFSFSSL